MRKFVGNGIQATSSSSFQGESENFLDSDHTSKPKAFQRNFLKKYTRDLVAASVVSQNQIICYQLMSHFVHYTYHSSCSYTTLNCFKDVWMGTQLLFVDISYTMRLVQKKLHGHRVTKRERRKIHRTTSDMFTLIPVVILMLLPVSWF